ncbi:MAG TPA: ATP-binding protein [Clostridia bacterium]|nr:ATP-binding protein [Clostridia bacterium]
MKSIKSRLIWSYLTVIALTSIFIISFFIFTFRQYYIVNMEEILRQHAETASRFFWVYLSSQDIEQNSVELINSFSVLTDAEIQVLDKKGMLLRGTQPSASGDYSAQSDVKAALTGKTEKQIGVISETGEAVLSVSAPLLSKDGLYGVIRFVTTLEEVNKVIINFAWIMIAFGATIILLVAIIGLTLANGIVRPIKELTQAAEQMASGVLTKHAAIRNNDEIGKLAKTMNFMADELGRQEKVKQSFIASISHEIRTPLTSIKGWAVILREYFVNSKASEVLEGLEIIEKESDRLTFLVDDLLDFSKQASGNYTLDIECLDLIDLLQDAAVQMKSKAQHTGISIVMQSEETSIRINGDRNRLKQVFLNVLDNAVKASSESSEIKITAQNHVKLVRIIIEDTGYGIPEEELPYITKMFYKVENRSAGSGLGLAICEEIIKLHKGKLEIQSKLGAGTKVIIALPL